jgi:hypothetical protein
LLVFVREVEVFHVVDISLYGILDTVVEVVISSQETRGEVVADAEHIVKHEDLTVGAGASANADSRYS